MAHGWPRWSTSAHLHSSPGNYNTTKELPSGDCLKLGCHKSSTHLHCSIPSLCSYWFWNSEPCMIWAGHRGNSVRLCCRRGGGNNPYMTSVMGTCSGNWNSSLCYMRYGKWSYHDKEDDRSCMLWGDVVVAPLVTRLLFSLIIHLPGTIHDSYPILGALIRLAAALLIAGRKKLLESSRPHGSGVCVLKGELNVHWARSYCPTDPYQCCDVVPA